MAEQHPRLEPLADRVCLTRCAVATAVTVAAQLGLRFDEPVILHDVNNTLVHLRPAPVVARVATMTRTVRQGAAWLALLARQHPAWHGRLEARLRWLREREPV